MLKDKKVEWIVYNGMSLVENNLLRALSYVKYKQNEGRKDEK